MMAAQLNFTNMSFDMINENDFSKVLGKKISTVRKETGLSQAQLAGLLGQCQQSIADYETGRRRIPACKVAMIADALGVSIVDLFVTDQNQLRKRGPTSKLQQQFERVKRLSRSDQKFIERMLDNALS